MNILNKRTLMIVGLSAVAIGFVRKHAKDPKNKDSFITSIADSLGLSA